jgi:hypothetical protein
MTLLESLPEVVQILSNLEWLIQFLAVRFQSLDYQFIPVNRYIGRPSGLFSNRCFRLIK